MFISENSKHGDSTHVATVIGNLLFAATHQTHLRVFLTGNLVLTNIRIWNVLLWRIVCFIGNVIPSLRRLPLSEFGRYEITNQVTPFNQLCLPIWIWELSNRKAPFRNLRNEVKRYARLVIPNLPNSENGWARRDWNAFPNQAQIHQNGRFQINPGKRLLLKKHEDCSRTWQQRLHWIDYHSKLGAH